MLDRVSVKQINGCRELSKPLQIRKGQCYLTKAQQLIQCVTKASSKNSCFPPSIDNACEISERGITTVYLMHQLFNRLDIISFCMVIQVFNSNPVFIINCFASSTVFPLIHVIHENTLIAPLFCHDIARVICGRQSKLDC